MTAENPNGLTHLDASGAARMVDVGAKPVTHRIAIAGAFVEMAPATLAMIVAGEAPKGDVLATARVAGIMAAKRTSDLIPLCHPLALTRVTMGEYRDVPETRAVLTDAMTTSTPMLIARSTSAGRRGSRSYSPQG